MKTKVLLSAAIVAAGFVATVGIPVEASHDPPGCPSSCPAVCTGYPGDACHFNCDPGEYTTISGVGVTAPEGTIAGRAYCGSVGTAVALCVSHGDGTCSGSSYPVRVPNLGPGVVIFGPCIVEVDAANLPLASAVTCTTTPSSPAPPQHE